MILENIKSILDAPEKLKININDFTRTWEYYFSQYQKAFSVLLKDSLRCKYQTNCKFMPFMFLFRHCIELYLKMKTDVYTSHDLKRFISGQPQKVVDIVNELVVLQKDKNGACWRYVTDDDGKLYFCGEKIYSYAACKKFNELFSLFHTWPVEEKRLSYELCFHPNECNKIGLVATQYDSAIIRLLQAVDEKEVEISEIYLPMLFLIRHSLELKLKDNILILRDAIGEGELDGLNKEHSVAKLYSTFFSVIKSPISKITDTKLKAESDNYKQITLRYKDLINKLDVKSFSFRYPFDKNGKETGFVPPKDVMIDALNLYANSDSFLCFVIPVLLEKGLLEIGEEVLC